MATLNRLEEMPESDVDDDPLRDWVGKEKVTMDTITFNQGEGVGMLLAESI